MIQWESAEGSDGTARGHAQGPVKADLGEKGGCKGVKFSYHFTLSSFGILEFHDPFFLTSCRSYLPIRATSGFGFYVNNNLTRRI